MSATNACVAFPDFPSRFIDSYSNLRRVNPFLRPLNEDLVREGSAPPPRPYDRLTDAEKQASLEERLRLNPHCTEAWQLLLAINPSAVNYERLLARFPSNPGYWVDYIEYLWLEGNVSQLPDVFRRCLVTCAELCLWSTYLLYTWRFHTAASLIARIDESLDRIGLDICSLPIRQESLIMKIKMFNCMCLNQGLSQTLLANPLTTGRIPTPILPSPAETLVFSSPIGGNSDRTFMAEYGEIGRLRRFYQEWLLTPVYDSERIWHGYCAFERSLSGSMALAQKLISEYEGKWNITMNVLKELAALYDGININEPAVPMTTTNIHHWKKTSLRWRKVLDYEKTNPLGLGLRALQRRVLFSFHSCLLSCGYQAEHWYECHQFLLAHGLTGPALEVLERPLERLLPEEDFLRMPLCNYYEVRGNLLRAEEIYASMQKRHEMERTTVDDGEIRDCETRSGAAGAMAYLCFCIRNYDCATVKRRFDDIKDRVSADVFVCHAYNMWRRYHDLEAALDTFETGYQRFWDSPRFMVPYVDFCVDLGMLDHARCLLFATLTRSWSDRLHRVLWPRWLKLEYRYGNMVSLRKVQLLAFNRSVVGGDAMGTLNDLDAVLGSFSSESPLCASEVRVLLRQDDPSDPSCSAGRKSIRLRQALFGATYDEAKDFFDLGIGPSRHLSHEPWGYRVQAHAVVTGREGDTADTRMDDFDRRADPPGSFDGLNERGDYRPYCRPDVSQMLLYRPTLSHLGDERAPELSDSDRALADAQRLLKSLASVLPAVTLSKVQWKAAASYADYLIYVLQRLVLPAPPAEELNLEKIVGLRQSNESELKRFEKAILDLVPSKIDPPKRESGTSRIIHLPPPLDISHRPIMGHVDLASMVRPSD